MITRQRLLVVGPKQRVDDLHLSVHQTRQKIHYTLDQVQHYLINKVCAPDKPLTFFDSFQSNPSVSPPILPLLKSLQTQSSPKIHQVAVSCSLKRFEQQIKQEYGLIDYHSKLAPAFFFGCYNNQDYSKIRGHRDLAVVIWGGTDCNTVAGKFKFKPNVFHLAISEQIHQKLLEVGIEPSQVLPIKLRLLDYQDYDQVAELGQSVYIYTAEHSTRAQTIYGQKVYNEVILRLPHINFIVAYGQYSKKEIIDVYKRCFIGLRLTKFDGSANTVQELALLGRPCVHNGTYPTSLGWSSVDDVVRHIETALAQPIDPSANRQAMLDHLNMPYKWLYTSFYRH